MGFTYADIKLTNSDDLALVRRGLLVDKQVKSMMIEMLVDTGAINFCINESIKMQLDLPVLYTHEIKLTDGSIKEAEILGPVHIQFSNRSTTVEAKVLPGDAEPSLGAIPLEGMDVMVDPVDQQLKLPPQRPYHSQYSVKSIKYAHTAKSVKGNTK